MAWKRTHSMCKTASYRSWTSMKQRCYNKNLKIFCNYGGRGITVCDRWLESFENFYEDMWDRPNGTSLDRINNDGNYEPSNCKWSTYKEQANNTRANRKFEYNGSLMLASKISEIIGVEPQKLIRYLDKWYTIDEIVNLQVKIVVKIHPDTGEIIRIYNTAVEAWKDSLIPSSSVWKCCRWLKNHKTAGGYKWEFYDATKHKKEEITVSNNTDSENIIENEMPLKYYICGDKTEYYLKTFDMVKTMC